MFLKTLLFKRFVFFLSACFISAIFSINPAHSFEVFFNRYFCFFLIFLIGDFLGRKKYAPLQIAVIFLLSGLFLGIGALNDYYYSHGERLVYSFGKGIFFSQYLTMYLPLSMVIMFFADGIKLRILGSLSFLLLYPCLVLNASRMAWLGSAFSVVFVFFFKQRKKFLILF
ncbi:MAG: hypothetical protein FJZ15_05375, partial [Candidatus Omnitrophica bacterium]|nr:hypothetical protein [Candidatus Omnitrophota bacterium]